MNERQRHPFSDPFLVAVQEGIAKRSKALSHRGQLTIRGVVGEQEQLELVIVPARGGTVILVAHPRNTIDVYVRSRASRDRGRVLFRVECLRVASNAAALLAAFEQTISIVNAVDDGEVPKHDIQRVWEQIAIQIAPS